MATEVVASVVDLEDSEVAVVVLVSEALDQGEEDPGVRVLELINSRKLSSDIAMLFKI